MSSAKEGERRNEELDRRYFMCTNWNAAKAVSPRSGSVTCECMGCCVERARQKLCKPLCQLGEVRLLSKDLLCRPCYLQTVVGMKGGIDKHHLSFPQGRELGVPPVLIASSRRF